MTHERFIETLHYANNDGNADAALAVVAELRLFASRADQDRPPDDWNAWKHNLEACRRIERWPMIQIHAEAALRAEFARLARNAEARRFT